MSIEYSAVQYKFSIGNLDSVLSNCLEMGVHQKCSHSYVTLSTRSANILAHGLYTRSAMRQYIGAGDFKRISSVAERALG